MPRTSARGFVVKRLRDLFEARMAFAMYRYMFDTPSPAEEELDDVAFLAYLDADRIRYHHRGPYKKRNMKESFRRKGLPKFLDTSLVPSLNAAIDGDDFILLVKSSFVTGVPSAESSSKMTSSSSVSGSWLVAMGRDAPLSPRIGASIS